MSNLTDPGESGYERDPLSDDEQSLLEASFSRAFEDTRTEGTTTLYDKFTDYWDEIKFAAEVARAQFDKRFDGQNPRNGYFGVDTIYPGYFGYVDWANTPDVEVGDDGENIYWLDGDAPDEFSSGQGGRDDPLRIGDGVVHIVLGVTSYEEDSFVGRHQFHKNDNPRSAFSSVEQYRNTDLNTAWLDAPIVLAEDDDLTARFVAGDDEVDASLGLRGVTFVEEKLSRITEPSEMAGHDGIVHLP